MKQRIPELDGLRALCILLVLASHIRPSLGTVAARFDRFLNDRLGVLGVTIFFVLSGFLITRLLVAESVRDGSVSLRGFYWRRGWRILPAYFVFLLGLAWLARPTACEWATLFTFTKNFFCVSDADIHIWSLSVEEQFYASWPLLFVLLRVRQCAMFLAAILFLWPAVRIAGHLLHYRFPFNGIAFYDAIGWGCAFALLLALQPELSARVFSWRAPLCRLLAWALIVGSWQLQVSLHLAWLTVPLTVTVQSVAGAFLIASYSSFGEARWLRTAPMVWLGRASYSIYLWQQLFLLAPLGFPQWLTAFPVNLCTCIAVGGLSYHWIERPAQRFAPQTRRLFPPPA